MLDQNSTNRVLLSFSSEEMNVANCANILILIIYDEKDKNSLGQQCYF